MKSIKIPMATFVIATVFVAVGAKAATPLLSNKPQARIAVDQSEDVTVNEIKNRVVLAQSSSGFTGWRNGFRSRALRAGISRSVFDNSYRGVNLNREVIRLDRRQAEFTKSLWEYLDTATSAKRVTNGRAMMRKYGKTVQAIEARYGVDKQVFVAIWGLETSYGSYMGNINVIESLSTLAYEGRRRKWAEGQLIEALKIIQRGDIQASRMFGSWAGAMGHTQFIPTSYQSFAQDFRGDGRRDVWSSDPTDALASTANYLRKHGWVKGQPWGIEVQVPANFNYGAADEKIRKSVAYWNSRGIRKLNGSAIPNYGEMAIIAPAGARGPKFAVFKNFRVIKRYNNATSYAIAVGHLGDKIAGGGEFRASWPRGEQALSRAQKKQLQQLLTRRGFNTQGTDGMIGPNTVKAIRRYQKSTGLVPDGHPSISLLKRLR